MNLPSHPAPVDQAYDAWSARYDSDVNRTRDLDEHVTCELLGDARADHVLEIGCGTGKNTVLLARMASRVTAMDFSEGMLAQARAKSGLEHVRFVRADITHVPWPVEGGFDLATCNLVLEHVKHLGPVFREAARVLNPGGRLLISELHPFRQYAGTRARFETDGQTTEIEAHIHHVQDFLAAASDAGFTLESLREWWHADDAGGPPRLLTLQLERRS